MTRPLLIHGGPILTMDADQPEVEAVLIEGSRIVATGTVSDLRALRPSAIESFDLQGRLATPGLYDAHAHIMGIGFAQSQVDISPDSVTSIVEIQQRLRRAAQGRERGAWIIAQGYDQASLEEQRHPNASDLDAVVPDHPLIAWRTCHHIAVANSAALRRAGVSHNIPDPPDGTFDRDGHGEPTGVLREAAATLVAGFQPPTTEDDIIGALQLGGMECRRNGITSAAEAGIRTRTEFRAYQRLWQAGELPLRTYLMMIIDDTLDELIELGMTSGFGDDWLRIGNAKLFADGSIGGRTARLRQPYEGEPANLGIWMIPPDEIRARVLKAHVAGFQLGIHAIGDAAIEVVIDAYERALAAHPRAGTRHRIEHCSLPDVPLLRRIAAIGAVPIPGTSFLHYTRASYLQNIGPSRARYAYALKTFDGLGIVAPASSDAPVVPVNPLIGIQTMVARQDRLGESVFPEERVTVERALRAYTVDAAWASFDERRKGRLRPDFLADMTVFDQDLRQLTPSGIMSAGVDATIADGTVVWERA